VCVFVILCPSFLVFPPPSTLFSPPLPLSLHSPTLQSSSCCVPITPIHPHLSYIPPPILTSKTITLCDC
jgi:hypothetical protein